MDTSQYDEWDKGCTDHALMLAEVYMNDYNNGIRFISFKTNQSKPVQEYKLMKVYHMLEKIGIQMFFKIFKKKDRILVEIELGNIIPGGYRNP
jgi:hypothetical protein